MNSSLTVPGNHAMEQTQTWSLVLAAGEGKRLQPCTQRADGTVVPKQYCHFRGAGTLLDQTIARQAAVSPAERMVLVVAEQHRRHWHGRRARLPQHSVVVQPRDCGTAMGLLLGLLHIARHDPFGLVVVTPADHAVRDANGWKIALRELVTAARASACVTLLGVQPGEGGGDYGWVMPQPLPGARLFRVDRFVEKPGQDATGELTQQGGLWSTFVLAAPVRALLELFAQTQPWLLNLALLQFRTAQGWEAQSVAHFYENLPNVDFSADVLEHAPERLRVLRSDGCGWLDLGTPERLDTFLRATGQHAVV